MGMFMVIAGCIGALGQTRREEVGLLVKGRSGRVRSMASVLALREQGDLRNDFGTFAKATISRLACTQGMEDMYRSIEQEY